MDVRHVAKLANLTLTEKQHQQFELQFDETIKAISVINEIDTSNVEPTNQVTGNVNITRPDEIDTIRILKPSQVLSASPSSHNGYFVVPSIFHEE